MSFVSNFTYSKMNTNPEMLTAREQLMEDIDCIISEFFNDTWGDYDEAECNQLIETICDAVCRNFPAN